MRMHCLHACSWTATACSLGLAVYTDTASDASRSAAVYSTAIAYVATPRPSPTPPTLLLHQELERLEKQASNAAVMRDPAAMKQLMAQIEDARRALETERARSEALRQQGEQLRKDAEVRGRLPCCCAFGSICCRGLSTCGWCWHCMRCCRQSAGRRSHTS
jgi:hypothetical protein